MQKKNSVVWKDCACCWGLHVSIDSGAFGVKDCNLSILATPLSETMKEHSNAY